LHTRVALEKMEGRWGMLPCAPRLTQALLIQRHAAVATTSGTPTYGRTDIHAIPAYVSMRQHTSACVSIRQHASAYVSRRRRRLTEHPHTAAQMSMQCLHTSAYVIRQHTSAYVSMRQHTSAYVRPHRYPCNACKRQHASAYVSIRQHTSA